MRDWLKKLQLEKYAADFERWEIDPDVLPAITDEHLKQMNMPLAERSRVLAAISDGVKKGGGGRGQ